MAGETKPIEPGKAERRQSTGFVLAGALARFREVASRQKGTELKRQRRRPGSALQHEQLRGVPCAAFGWWDEPEAESANCGREGIWRREYDTVVPQTRWTRFASFALLAVSMQAEWTSGARTSRTRRTPGRGGGPDGGVHDLFVVTGRKDAEGCNIAQPNFDAAVSQRNAFFRIPTPVYGAGLIEAITEASIMNNLRADRPLKDGLGIGGRANRSESDGTITRFGWKAQDKSLVSFAGEALNVEEGITNEQFPHEREDTPGCVFNASPEDHVRVSAVAEFMRYLAPPAPGPETESTARGKKHVFESVGCAACHSPNLRTGKTEVAALNERWVPLYSDLALHDMGPALEDFIDQGQARGRDWRTAPLWGLGQRIFLMHDGRTKDLVEAIKAHGSAGSEGYQSTGRFEALKAEEKQDVLNFLRSL